MASATKKKTRQYSIEYLSYGFIQSPDNITKPMCLICTAVLSNESMKPIKLRNHLETKHSEKKNKSVEYFQKLRDDFQGRNTLDQTFRKQVSNQDRGLLASYEICKIIAKSGKPHSIGETVILPSISVVISTVMNKNAREITDIIPLSNNTVARRIDEMSQDVENQLIAQLQVKQFAIQLDESTLRDNEALLMAYVRFMDDNQLREEMLFARCLKTDTKGQTIFNEVQSYFKENNIPLGNIMACATDGAPSMVGRYRGFIAHLKNVLPKVLCIHCVVHRQHLVAKKLSGRLHEALTLVIKAVNLIKANALQDRLFREFCIENDEGFDRLVLHTEVRWLSKGNCLRRFIKLWDSIVSFLNNKEIGGQLVSMKYDIFYLSDVFEKLNSLNKLLQGHNCELISSKEAITAFLGKLKLYSLNIARRAFDQFPNLASISSELQDDDCALYVEHLKKIHEDMQVRFKDLLEMNIPVWVLIPFEVNVADVDINLQEELVELQCDETARSLLKKGKHNIWKNSDIARKYPLLWEKAKMYVIAFPTSYLVESGFSRVSHLLTKNRNRLDIVKRGDLRLSLTTLEPDIKKLSSMHQSQGSH